MPRGRPKKIKQTVNKIEKEPSLPQNIMDDNVISINKEPQEIDVNLKKAVNDLTKQFGHSIIHLAKDEEDKERLPFGIETIDNLIGNGIPAGMFTILWGNKGVAKTTLTYHLIAQAQKKNKKCLFLDLEGSFDKIWAEKCGINLDTLLIGHFKTAEEAMDTMIQLTNKQVIDLIVLDSVQSLSPTGEKETKTGKEKSVEDDTMALLARKLSQFFRMAASGVYEGKVAVLLIGQARIDLGSFIKLDTLSGGKALGHWSVITLKAYRGNKADAPRYRFKVDGKSKEIIIGFDLHIRLEKRKISGTAPENSEIRIPFYDTFGFQQPTDKQILEIYKDWVDFEKDNDE